MNADEIMEAIDELNNMLGSDSLDPSVMRDRLIELARLVGWLAYQVQQSNRPHHPGETR